MKEKVSVIMLVLLFAGALLGFFGIQRAGGASRTWTVDDDGAADFLVIQDAVNAAQQGDIVFVRNGIYYEHVVINKSISLVGENRSTTIIDGNNAGTVVLVAADNVIIKGFTVRNGENGINVVSAYNCTVEGNLVKDNRVRGILISKSQNCTVRRNYAVRTKSMYGININASKNILVEENSATNNYFDGIGLFSSNKSIVRGNTVNNNSLFGIVVDYHSNYNIIYHNNLFNNNIQVASSNPTNVWDNGAEGNYWGDYAEVDANGDGVGDTPYIVDKETKQQDNYPLIQPYVNEIYRSIDTEPPVASFTYSSGDIFVNETVNFDASDSYDAVGKHAIAYYFWNFGDGAVENTTDPVANHTYLTPGNYSVTLKVVDVAGNEGYASAEIQILKENMTNEQPFPTWIGVSVAVIVLGVLISVFWLRKKRKPR
jgi:parallel beta-helix repeat protein